MDRNLVRATALATQTIFRDLVGWELHLDDVTTNQRPAKGTPELNAVISFNGMKSGAFVLHMSEPLSAVLASTMLGVGCPVGSVDAKDAIGELLNMITGAIKNHYQSQRDPFKISVPTIVSGTDFSIHVKVDSEDEIVSLGFQHVGGDERVGLKLMLVSG